MNYNRKFPWVVIENQSGYEYLVAGFVSGSDAEKFAQKMREGWPTFTYRVEHPGY